MYTEQQFIELEQEERTLTDEAIAIMLLLLANTKDNLKKELRSFYQQYGSDGVVTYAEARKWVSEKDHRRRLTVLTLLVSGAFASAFSDLEKHFRRFLTDIINKESIFFGVTVDIDKLLKRKWSIDDLYWLKRLENDVNLWNIRILADIKKSIRKGATIDSVLTQIDKRFKNINTVLDALGLSESTAVGSLTRQSIFKELGVSKYQFYTKDDERRCEECGALHGKIFPMSAYEVGFTASPIHTRCRCWEVPIMG